MKQEAPSGKVAGIIMAIAALLSLVGISLHPVAATHNPTTLLPELVSLRPMDELVHGALLVLALGLLFGLSVFSLRRGLHRQLVVAALIAYGTGVIALICAALADGFVTPWIAARYEGGTPQEIAIAIEFLVLCAIVIQVSTRFAIAAISIAIACWSADLLPAAGALRVSGAIGMIAAIVSIGAMILGPSQLNPHGLMAIVGLEAIFYLAVATLLVRQDA